MINNRQSGRRRGRGGGNGQRPQGGGGGGRPDNGNRIDNRARGNAAQLLEKYKNLAADAQRQGDRVNTEYYLQFADHYFRVLSETRARQEEAQGQQSQQRRPQPADPFRDQFGDFESDEDFADEGEAIRPGEQMMAQQGRDGDQRPERAERSERRDDRNGERPDRNGERRDAGRPRLDRERPDRSEQPRHRQPRPLEAQGEERSQDRGQDRDQERFQDRGSDRDQGRRVEATKPEPVAVEPSLPLEADRAPEAPAEAPRRRGRPRRVDTAVESAATASPDAASDEAPRGVEGLPPAIGLSNVANGADEESAEAPKPRRRRTPRAAGVPAAE